MAAAPYRVIVDAPESKKTYILDAARWRLVAALRKYDDIVTAKGRALPRTVRLDVRALAILCGEIQSANGHHLDAFLGRRTRVPPELSGRLTVYLFMLAEVPRIVPGWMIQLDRTASVPRLRCERTEPGISMVTPATA